MRKPILVLVTAIGIGSGLVATTVLADTNIVTTPQPPAHTTAAPAQANPHRRARVPRPRYTRPFRRHPRFRARR